MHRFPKTLSRRISHCVSGTLLCAAVFVSSTVQAQLQTKSITPDPYFTGSQSSDGSIKKPVDLTGRWKTPVNLGIDRTPSVGSDTRSSLPSNAVTKPETSSQSSGFGLNSVGSLEGSSVSASGLSAGNAFSSLDKPVKTASAIGTQLGAAESASQTQPRSLIVQASENPNNGQGSTHRQVGHQEASRAAAFRPGKVLALVGGEPVFVGDLMFKINQIIEEKMAGAPEEIKEQQRQAAIPLLLPQFVESKLLYQGAVRGLPDGVDLEGIFEQVEGQFEISAMPKMMESAGVKSVVEFDARLRGQDYSLRQLKRNWAVNQFTRHSVSQAIGKVSETTHQEMLDRYQEKLASYEKPARAKWEQIVVRFERTGSKSEAKKMIVDIGNRIVHGANFAATAKAHSHGYNASEGGHCDWTTQGALALDEIDKAVFSLPIGVLSEIIETKGGFYIVRVIDRELASRTSFLDAQVDIRKEIEGEKRKVAFDKYVDKLRKEIPVEYLINE